MIIVILLCGFLLAAPVHAQLIVQAGFGGNSANSISGTSGGMRTDPEGVAAPEGVVNVTWKDSRGADRTAVLGGYLHQYNYSFLEDPASPAVVTSRSANDDAYGHPGFGYVVSHSNSGNSPLGKINLPASVTTVVFAGGHHAIHRVEFMYDRDKEGDGRGIQIPVVIEWLIATGRDHPVWSVTWKVGNAVNPLPTDFNNYRMDVRGPYGSLNFDGAATAASGDAIGGVAWGDFGLKFVTSNAELNLSSPWAYNTPNTIDFTQAWTETINGEMGIVQTRAGDSEMGYQDRVTGRERGSTSVSAYADKSDCTAMSDLRVYTVPCVNGWPYQLMNYDWDPSGTKPVGEATGTKLIAWGTPYGWLGADSFCNFDYSDCGRDGTGDRAYATLIVLGAKCRIRGGMCDPSQGDVAQTLGAVDALASATVSAVTAGSLVTQVPKGPGATQTKTISSGYNDTYAAYYLRADPLNVVSLTFTPAAAKPVQTPIFVISNYTSGLVPVVTMDGVSLAVNAGTAASGAFASLNTDTNELWVTVNQIIAATTAIVISSP
jgi:hypothetical protein